MHKINVKWPKMAKILIFFNITPVAHPPCPGELRDPGDSEGGTHPFAVGRWSEPSRASPILYRCNIGK
eukprot:NODE_2543_length_465_cov_27.033654_g2100_i0.p2 GENE.NODE_2543_length_465_cov_27.033654_g2100_i0~~NODE_2543_length_465_cov_27.033654_g2100_i0.p2  ORF type:complete len:68 (+),score=1.57 NODE_2543_length_465_cov_27.033654_g2100_i0:213-416(+)